MTPTEHYHLLVHELTQGAWLVLATALAFMFGYIAVRAWRELGYHSAETRGAISLAVLFIGSTLSRVWLWLQVFLANHGYPELATSVFQWVMWPIAAQVIAVAGGLCAVRVFYPMWGKKTGMFSCDATWMIPLVLMLLFLLVTSLV